MNRNWFSLAILALIGINLGWVWLISPGSLFMLLLAVFFTAMLSLLSKAEDRRFLMTLFLLGLGLRVLISLFFVFISIFFKRNIWITGDGWGLYNYAWAFTQCVDGWKEFVFMEAVDGSLYIAPCPLARIWEYGYNGFTYLLGGIYYFFGPLKFSSRILNCLMGAGIGIFIYHIAKDIFGMAVAKLSAVLAVFTPSLFLWSLTLMKDIPFILTTTLILWSFLRYVKTKKIFYLFTLCLAILGQYTIRPQFTIGFILLSLLLSYFVLSKLSRRTKLYITLCLFLLMIPVSLNYKLNDLVRGQMHRIINYSRGIIASEGSTYKVFDDKYYSPGSLSQAEYISFTDFVKGILRGWFYFILVPFPWKIYSRLQMLSYPQVLLWYLFLPFVFLGIISALRYKWRETFVILSYIIITGTMVVITSGNIGTVFRHRDMFTPLFLIFGSLGLLKVSGRLKNLNREEANAL
ncbi:MAG: glycosyltransferase family 39 protein [Candidatus Omnitrophica bacterium]|nr:glycosyltransferase family 39 protein [Candidatus Omnitrophota bacterium]